MHFCCQIHQVYIHLKWEGLSLDALSSNYIGYCAADIIKTLLRRRHVVTAVRRSQKRIHVTLHVHSEMRTVQTHLAANKFEKAWDSFAVEHPNCVELLWSTEQILLGSTSYYVLKAMVEVTIPWSLHSKPPDTTRVEWYNRQWGRGKRGWGVRMRPRPETEIGTEAESDTKTIILLDSEKIPEFGICEETGVVSLP